jgi:hypothetical protein
MVGFRPTIHDFFVSGRACPVEQVVDGRDKRDHDDLV